jgi:hypothetical protein
MSLMGSMVWPIALIAPTDSCVAVCIWAIWLEISSVAFTVWPARLSRSTPARGGGEFPWPVRASDSNFKQLSAVIVRLDRPPQCAMAHKAGDDDRGDVSPRSRGMMRPRLCVNFGALDEEGAGKAGCRLHPWAPCNKKHGGRTTGVTGNNPAFPARWFYGLLRALPGDRAFFATVIPRCDSQNLAPASGRQNHTTSPSASGLRSSVAAFASTASHRAFVTIASRPSCRVRRASW